MRLEASGRPRTSRSKRYTFRLRLPFHFCPLTFVVLLHSIVFVPYCATTLTSSFRHSFDAAMPWQPVRSVSTSHTRHFRNHGNSHSQHLSMNPSNSNTGTGNQPAHHSFLQACLASFCFIPAWLRCFSKVFFTFARAASGLALLN